MRIMTNAPSQGHSNKNKKKATPKRYRDCLLEWKDSFFNGSDCSFPELYFLYSYSRKPIAPRIQLYIAM